MSARGFFKQASQLGINLNGVSFADNRLEFTNVEQSRQDALNAALKNYDPTKDDFNDKIDAQIVALEREADSARRRREALLTEEGKAWMEAKEAEIISLRNQKIK